MSQFTTEFGHFIPFIPGYFEGNRQYLDYAMSNELSATDKREIKQPGSVSKGAFIKCWVSFSALVHFLERHKLLKRRSRTLDLGGAEGTVSRLFKAAGLAEEATNVDLTDYSKAAGDQDVDNFLETCARHPDPADEYAWSTVFQTKHKTDYRVCEPILSGMVTQFPNRAILDRNLQNDVFEVTGLYDQVTAFLMLQYFDLDRVLPKVRSLLPTGGLFAAVAEYWWFPINSTGVIGHFPYAEQRLSFKDLEKYCSENHPGMFADLSAKYHYFHEGHHPTIADWFDAGRRHGFRPVAVERIMPRRNIRVVDAPHTLFQAPWFDHREVLRDIHYLSPGVTVEDLYTSHFRIAMVAI